jgi:hypothetical protein
VQLDIRVAAIAADVEHVKLHRRACLMQSRANAGSRARSVGIGFNARSLGETVLL